MRKWLATIALGFLACGRVEAGTASARLMVSATVVDRCIVGAIPSANAGARGGLVDHCQWGTPYAIALSSERVAVPVLSTAQLTSYGEGVQSMHDAGASSVTGLTSVGRATADDGTGASGGIALSAYGAATVATARTIDAVRVTVSF